MILKQKIGLNFISQIILVMLFKCLTENAPDYLCSKFNLLILFMIIVL